MDQWVLWKCVFYFYSFQIAVQTKAPEKQIITLITIRAILGLVITANFRKCFTDLLAFHLRVHFQSKIMQIVCLQQMFCHPLVAPYGNSCHLEISTNIICQKKWASHNMPKDQHIKIQIIIWHQQWTNIVLPFPCYGNHASLQSCWFVQECNSNVEPKCWCRWPRHTLCTHTTYIKSNWYTSFCLLFELFSWYIVSHREATLSFR